MFEIYAGGVVRGERIKVKGERFVISIMKFNQIILENLEPLFQKYNLNISEQWDNYVQVRSDHLVIVFAHNKYDNSNTLFLNRNNGKPYTIEIDNSLLKSFFNSDLKLSEVPVDVFVNNLVLFFEDVGVSILNGDLNRIGELEKFNLERSRIYTANLLARQKLYKK